MTNKQLQEILKELPDETPIVLMGSNKPINVFFVQQETDYILLDEEPMDHLFESWEIKNGTVKQCREHLNLPIPPKDRL